MIKPNIAPCTLWLTGLSGSGKSTTAYHLKIKFEELGVPCFLLDGDILRQSLCSDLGFSEADRYESCRRMAELAKQYVETGSLVICASISPYKKMRSELRVKFSDAQFIEVFVDAPLSVCEARDPKGLYKKARRGEIQLFTGIDSAYEAPDNPEIHLNTATESIKDCTEKIIDYLIARGLITQ